MTLPYDPLSPPPRDKARLRRMLKAERMNLVDRLQRSEQLQAVLRVWLTQREDATVGAYWAIKDEFDPLPALHRLITSAGSASTSPAVTRPLAGTATPRRASRTVSFCRAAASRDSTVPRGMPSSRAASAVVRPSR